MATKKCEECGQTEKEIKEDGYDFKIQWKIYLVDGTIEINKACEIAKKLAKRDECEIMFSFPNWLKEKYPIAVRQQKIDYDTTDNWSFLGINKALLED